MRKKYALPFILSLLVIVLLTITGCGSREAHEFINNPKIQKQAKEMVVETLAEDGLRVTILDDANYLKGVKGSIIEDKIGVFYQTEHEPTFIGMATIQVDIGSQERKLTEVIQTEILSQNPSVVDLYDQLISYAYPLAFQTALNAAKQPGGSFLDLKFNENDNFPPLELYIRLDLAKQNVTNQQIENLLAYYRNDTFVTIREEQAKKLMDDSLVLNLNEEGNEVLPKIHLNYQIDGTFSNEKMDQFLDDLLAIEGLPDALFEVIVSADHYEEPPDNLIHRKIYNQDIYGNFSPMFIGYLKIEKGGRLKNRSIYF